MFFTGVAGTGLRRDPQGRAVKYEAQIPSPQVDTESETPVLPAARQSGLDFPLSLTKPHSELHPASLHRPLFIRAFISHSLAL